MAQVREYTLTSAIGNFSFTRDIPMSLAKLVRDTVMAEYLNSKRGRGRMKTARDCQAFMHENASKTLAEVPFTLDLLDEPKVAVVTDDED